MFCQIVYTSDLSLIQSSKERTWDVLWTFWPNQKVKVIVRETCTNCRVYSYQSLLQISARFVKVFYHFVMSLVWAHIQAKRKYCVSQLSTIWLWPRATFSASVALIKSYKIIKTRGLKKSALGLFSISQCVNWMKKYFMMDHVNFRFPSFDSDPKPFLQHQ